MSEGRVKWKVELDLTTGAGTTYVDYSAKSRLRGAPFGANRISTSNVSSKVQFDIAGLDSGNVQLTLLPDTPGETLATAWDAAVRNGTLVYCRIEKVPETGETAAPSTDAPRWVYTGHVFDRIGVPQPHGDEKAHDVEISIKTAQIDTSGGLADL